MTATPHPVQVQALLEDYATIARRRGPRVLEATALRSESLELRSLHAHLASGGTLTLDQILDRAASGDASGLDPQWTASLGRTMALQNYLPSDRQDGARLLEIAVGAGLKDDRGLTYTKLLAELYLSHAEHQKARALLSKYSDLKSVDHGKLSTDLVNPFAGSPFANQKKWGRSFGRLFESAGIEAPSVVPTSSCAFDGLTADAPVAVANGPVVSVILTTFKPRREDVLLSARSILDQTYADVELLVVDDCSPAEFDGVLEDLAQLDDRVRLIKLPVNGGTYLARNAGIREATGVFVTCQDADDWSHPRRIEQQVRPLLDDPTLPGTRSRCITVLEDLTLGRPGYIPLRANASSLMFRREDALRTGGFLEARRAADSELHFRLEALSGRKVVTLDAPLAIVRILGESLSRSDFRAGWSHPARRTFVGAYQHWHSTVPSDELHSQSPTVPPIPTRFAVVRAASDEYDVVLAGDWRAYGGPQKSMIEEIKALRKDGLKVGVLHLEAARFMTAKPERLCTPVQELINDGTVTRVLYDESHTVRLLVLRYPPILQFPPRIASSLHVQRFVVLANQAPSERDGSDRRYVVETCTVNAERMFGVEPLWAPQGPVVRSAISSAIAPDSLAGYDLPGVVDLDEWQTERVSFRSDIPVVGRHSRDDRMKWPARASEIAAAYPTDGRYDVRVMGGVSSALAVLQRPTVPEGWVAFPKDELEVRTFLNSLDFFVNYTHHEAYEAFGRAVLEALATGCVTVLPETFRETFGDAALYGSPSDVQAIVDSLYESPARYRAQSRRAIEAVRQNFSYESYLTRIRALLAQQPTERLSAGGPSSVRSLPAAGSTQGAPRAIAR